MTEEEAYKLDRQCKAMNFTACGVGKHIPSANIFGLVICDEYHYDFFMKVCSHLILGMNLKKTNHLKGKIGNGIGNEVYLY